MNLVDCKTENGGFLLVKLDTETNNVFVFSGFDNKEHVRKAKFLKDSNKCFCFSFNKRKIVAQVKEN